MTVYHCSVNSNLCNRFFRINSSCNDEQFENVFQMKVIVTQYKIWDRLILAKECHDLLLNPQLSNIFSVNACNNMLKFLHKSTFEETRNYYNDDKCHISKLTSEENI